MSGDAPLTWLMFFTLASAIIVGAGFLLWFLRSRQNREVAAYALEGRHYRAESDRRVQAQSCVASS